jgi:hypothetical protein
MSAYDRIIEREDMDRRQDISTEDRYAPQSYSSGVSLFTFVEELFTEDKAH